MLFVFSGDVERWSVFYALPYENEVFPRGAADCCETLMGSLLAANYVCLVTRLSTVLRMPAFSPATKKAFQGNYCCAALMGFGHRYSSSTRYIYLHPVRKALVADVLRGEHQQPREAQA